jgi:hypothetical protein
MPNFGHLATNLVYHLGLALWIGGTVALGALVAPQLFRTLPRYQAGAIFGQILRRFARVRLVALVATIAAAAVKHLVWERNVSLWIGIRWAALAFLAAAIVYEVGVLEKAMEARRVHLTPETADDDPHRRAFTTLHKRAEALMKTSLLAAIAAMLLS